MSRVAMFILQNQEPPEGWPRFPRFNDKGDVPGPPVQFGEPVKPETAPAGLGFLPNGQDEKNIYYHHPDHLGSANYITDAKGKISQHTEYIAFGEILYDEHNVDVQMPYLFNGKELDEETGLYYYGARYYNPKTSLWLNTDPLAEKTMEPYSYAYNNPIRIIDPDGREGEDWIRKGNKFSWDDRVVNQKTASQYHPGAEYIGKSATVTSIVKGSGKILDTTHLNTDGSITQNGKTITENSIDNRSFSNKAGSTFIPRQTTGSFYGFSANFAAFGGFGVSFGIVSDSVEDWTSYFSFNANLGLGMGASADIGVVKPTGKNQFLVSDFEGKGASYSYGISTPLVDLGRGTGGTLNSGYNSNDDYFNSGKWGRNKRGYTTSQAALSKGTGWGAGAMWTYGQTWIKK